MPVKVRLMNEEKDETTKDVDDLDLVYLEKMKESGIDEELLEQFKELSIELNQQR
ncbi:hypothetical protein [Dubosiella newyorkensis]|uniref:hypothetical protein n=1 Tax=Dubosiella newyorkensis TaxID=1862672 RepID=UPI0023F54927|nr:hypothetical protein [Dubosiella newyorkensis]